MTRPRTVVRAAAVLVLVAAALGALPARAEFRALTIGYLQIRDDARYAEHRAYAGLRLRDRQRPLAGAQVAIKDSRAIGRARQMAFALEEVEAADGDDLIAQMRRLRAEKDVRFFVVDAPAAVLIRAAAAADEALLFNITEPADALRGADCASNLLHTLPSRAMLADALAQYLVAKGWRDVLLLKGPLPEDAVLADAFAGAAKKFGARIVATKDFVPGLDPRNREQNNIVLLTAAPRHDVVYLADSDGEFGRYVPYQTSAPRPVVGSEGLVASAWHWTWERHGAPQLNQRFERHAGRAMQDTDWAAWVAVKAIVEAAVRTESTAFAPVAAYLRGADLALDVYKGTPASVRAWDNQLRQPILLHTHNAVIDRAPLPGFLHPSEYMDTLGPDAPESACRF